MITINLLPKEIEKKSADRKRCFLISGVAVLIVLILMGIYFLRVTELASLRSNINVVETELKKLTPIVQRVNDIRSKKTELDRKIGVIRDLMKTRLLYPIFMEYFAALIPSEVWITSLNTQTEGNRLILNFNALARDNFAVAEFINRLEISEKFSDIIFVGMTTISFEEEEVRSFTIGCTYTLK